MDVIEFVKDEKGKLSISRILTLGAFVVTSFVMAKLTIMGGMNEGYFSLYLGAFVVNGLVSKKLDKAKVETENV